MKKENQIYKERDIGSPSGKISRQLYDNPERQTSFLGSLLLGFPILSPRSFEFYEPIVAPMNY